MKVSFLTLFAFMILSSPAHAVYQVLDNGEILKSGDYKLTGTTQFLTDSGGANLAARMDMGLTEDVGFRGLFGFGKTDFFFGALGRWMPIKESGHQPTIGGNAGLVYVKDGSIRDLIMRVEPLVSKRFDAGSALFSPYVSLPMGVRVRDSDYGNDSDDITWQIVIGSQLQVERWKNLQFIAELGLDLNKAPGYFSVGAILYFDNQTGIVIE